MAGVVDQVASSLTNFVVLFAALRTLSISDLGTFTFAYTLALLAVTVVRALALEPLTIRFTTADPAARRSAIREAAGASLLLGIGTCIACAITGPFLPTTVSGAVLAFGAVVPVLLLQDAWRMYHLACGRPWSAVANDAGCLVVSLVLLVWLLLADPDVGVAWLLLGWGAATLTGAVGGIAQARACPWPHRGWAWLRRHRDLGLPLAGERSAESTAAQASLLVVALVAGGVALGQLGAARALMAPITTLTTSVVLFGLPEAARLRHRSRLLRRLAAGMSVVTAGAVVAFAGFLYVAPALLGTALAGDNWEMAKTLLIPVAVWTAASGARSGPSVALRALQRAGSLALLSVGTGTVVLGVTFAGAELGGARGAAWGFALTYVVAVAAYWIVLLRTTSPAASGGAAAGT